MSSTINYSLERLLEEDGGRQHILAELTRIQRDYRIAGGKVIELGCGHGRNLAVFQGANEVSGVEGLASAVEHARSRGLNVLQADLAAPLPLPTAAFDCVMLLDVLEHLEWPQRCLQEAARIARPGGLVIVNLPNHFTMTARVRILLGRGGVEAVGYFPESAVWDYPHLRFFQHRSATALLASAGLQIVEDRSFMFPAVPMSHELRKVGLGRLLPGLARRYPDAFAAGFFLISRRPEGATT